MMLMLATDRELVRTCHSMFSEMVWLAEEGEGHELRQLLRACSWGEAIRLLIETAKARLPEPASSEVS